MTLLQREIRAAFQSSSEPLSVPALMEYLTRQGLKPHKTTLYRNLERMVADSEIEEILIDAHQVYYELKVAHHHHALCRICKKVMCITQDMCDGSVAHLESALKSSNFRPTGHHVVLYGECGSCQS